MLDGVAGALEQHGDGIMMPGKVLFVDDEPNVLDGIRRQLRQRIEVVTAPGGEEGLKIIRQSEPFAVVVSDMRMPRMSGADFLARVRELSPDSVRMILSGQSELENAISAVNEGQIFRFLTKPCSPELLWKTLEAGLEQYRLITVEKELLDQTLRGAVQTMVELIGFANPAASDKATRVQRYADQLGESLGLGDDWEFRVGVLLSQIGCVALPEETLAKLDSGGSLSSDEQKLYKSHPVIAAKLLANIPRMNAVAEMIGLQDQPVDPEKLPTDTAKWPSPVLGGTILRIANDFDALVTKGRSVEEAVTALRGATSRLPERIREAVEGLGRPRGSRSERRVGVKDLLTGMILAEDVITPSGVCLLKQGQEVTQTHLVRLRTAAEGIGIVEPFRVVELDAPEAENEIDLKEGIS